MSYHTFYKIDLHTHSIASKDASTTEKDYEEIIAKKILDVVAITDHNSIDVAMRLHKKLGDAIIVGEEIMTKAGEVIGLFLSAKIEPGQSLAKTIQCIHAQDGLVYIPHPLDKFRKGIGRKNLLRYKTSVDVVESFNARSLWRENNTKTREICLSHGIVQGVGSDSHSVKGLGGAYGKTKKSFGRQHAKELLRGADFIEKYQPWYEYLKPKWNILLKKFGMLKND